MPCIQYSTTYNFGKVHTLHYVEEGSLLSSALLMTTASALGLKKCLFCSEIQIKRELIKYIDFCGINGSINQEFFFRISVLLKPHFLQEPPASTVYRESSAHVRV